MLWPEHEDTISRAPCLKMADRGHLRTMSGGLSPATRKKKKAKGDLNVTLHTSSFIMYSSAGRFRLMLFSAGGFSCGVRAPVWRPQGDRARARS